MHRSLPNAAAFLGGCLPVRRSAFKCLISPHPYNPFTDSTFTNISLWNSCARSTFTSLRVTWQKHQRPQQRTRLNLVRLVVGSCLTWTISCRRGWRCRCEGTSARRWPRKGCFFEWIRRRCSCVHQVREFPVLNFFVSFAIALFSSSEVAEKASQMLGARLITKQTTDEGRPCSKVLCLPGFSPPR